MNFSGDNLAYWFCRIFTLWVIFLSSGKVIVHALDEKARAYYNLESLWTSDASKEEPVQVKDKIKDFETFLVFIQSAMPQHAHPPSDAWRCKLCFLLDLEDKGMHQHKLRLSVTFL